MKRSLKILLTLAALFSFAACGRHEVIQSGASPPQASTTPATAQPGPSGNLQTTGAIRPKTDACELLTSAEIESVQKESVETTKLSGTAEGGLSLSQCFFKLPTFSNSISLQVVQKGEGSGARDPKEFWNDTFHREQEPADERERERERAREQIAKKEENEESTPPRKIDGLGDEAFWVGSRVGGALYVLKENSYLRISVGGAGDQNSKIKKSTMLAQKALMHLSS